MWENPKQPKFFNLGGERKEDLGEGSNDEIFGHNIFSFFQLYDLLPSNMLGQLSEVQYVCVLTNVSGSWLAVLRFSRNPLPL